MSKQQTVSINSQLMDAIRAFLSAPPEGTPEEIIEAFNFIGAESLLLPALFLQTIEQAPVAITITDPDACILYVNTAFEQLSGYHRDELIGNKPSLLSSPSTPVAVYEDLWCTIQDKCVWRGKLVNHRKDQQEYLADLTISPVISDSGDILYFLGMQHDITEMYKLEQSLKFQKSLAEAAINVAPMVVAMIAVDHQILMANLAYKDLAEDFSDIEPAELFMAAIAQQTGFKFSQAAIENKEFTNIEVCLKVPGASSSRWFSCSGVCVVRPDETAEHYFKIDHVEQQYLLLIANDITRQRQRTNEARLNMLRNNMAEQQTVQSIRESISASVYKLKLPLNVMKAALSVPGEGFEKCSLRTTLLDALDSSDEAMDSLQNSIPRPVSEECVSVNINIVIHEVIKLSTEQLLSSGVVIDWRPSPYLPFTCGKINALHRLFKYLIDNAIEAVNESNHKNKMIRLDTSLDDQELLIEIADNGIGLQENLKLKVFEPFFCHWEKSASHVGMGLTLAQEVIVEHAGSIEFDTDFFGGCRLLVRIPLHKISGE